MSLSPNSAALGPRLSSASVDLLRLPHWNLRTSSTLRLRIIFKNLVSPFKCFSSYSFCPYTHHIFSFTFYFTSSIWGCADLSACSQCIVKRNIFAFLRSVSPHFSKFPYRIGDYYIMRTYEIRIIHMFYFIQNAHVFNVFYFVIRVFFPDSSTSQVFHLLTTHTHVGSTPPVSRSVTPLFHSRLKTRLFFKSFQP